MPEATDSMELLLQNLKDAGCDEKMISQCMALATSKQLSEILLKLKKHKKQLLDIVHSGQKEIDCLDYLIYSVSKRIEKEKKNYDE
ncbi:MAG: hypothetical protein PHE06_10230 [Lachnospiraceae bacterium]|jgi:hypothetical protein|nr:hypothetical protein [Lachnospiraceae bacterium]MDD3796326.1 hypothetical protein [Lachnospiraceae bacterium]